MINNIKELEQEIKELEEKKKQLLFKQERENYIKNKEQEKVSAIVSYRSIKERELAYEKYEHFLKLFNYFFDGVATEEQLLKIYGYGLSNVREEKIKEILSHFRIFGLARERTSNIEKESLFLITTFSVVRIYGNKNLRGITRVADSTLKKRLRKNDYILWLIENINKGNIKGPSYKINNHLNLGTSLSEVIKQEDLNYLNNNYKKIDFSFLNGFDNTKAFDYISKYTNLTTEDTTLQLKRVYTVMKKTNNLFYSERLLEQLALISKKKQLMDPKIKEKEAIREELAQGRVHFKEVSNVNRSSLLTLLDLENRNVFIRRFYFENDLLHIDLDVLEVGTILRTTEMEYLLLDINDIFDSIFGQGEIETYFINIHWHLGNRPEYTLYRKRVRELAQGRGNKKATRSINNIFIVERNEIFNQKITPLNISEYKKVEEKELKNKLKVNLPHKDIAKDINPTEAPVSPQRPQNNSNEDKPNLSIKTPQKPFKEETSQAKKEQKDLINKTIDQEYQKLQKLQKQGKEDPALSDYIKRKKILRK